MQIKAWSNFSKRKNSTKRPADNEAILIDVKLKNSTSIEDPSFILQSNNYNINYIQGLDHYYYVTGITILSNELMEIQCAQDLLATYKDEIGVTNVYVLYSSSNYNVSIKDDRLSMKETVLVNRGYTGVPISSDTEGTFILLTAGSQENAQVGMTSAYAITSASFKELADWFYSGNITEELAKLFKSPYDSLISCIWIPWTLSAPSSEQIYIGNQALVNTTTGNPIKGRPMGNILALSQNESTLFIPWNYPTKDFRNSSDYTKILLYLPFYGNVELDPAQLFGKESIKISWVKDNITGELIYHIRITDQTILTYRVSLGVEVPIGQVTTHQIQGFTEMIGGVASATAGLASGNPLLAIGGAAAFGKGVVSSFTNIAEANGGTGSFATGKTVLSSEAGSDYRIARMTCISHELSEEPESSNEIFGRPLMETKKISSLSGYIMTSNASVSIPGLEADKEEINKYMNGGFYYE